MNNKDKKFHLKKNSLDNEYSKTLSYMQIFTVGVITLFVGITIFFLQVGNASSIVTNIAAGTASILMVLYFFRKKLNVISDSINSL